MYPFSSSLPHVRAQRRAVGQPCRTVKHPCWGNRPGTTATELAIVLPLLILVTLACSDFARIIQYRQVVANAARTGAHRGALQQCTDYTRPDWEQQVRQAVVDDLQHLTGFDESAAEIAIESSEDVSGNQRVAVEVELPFETLITWPGLPSQVLLNHRAEFQHFR